MVSSLAELVLSRNQLSGSIPPGLFKYENLTLLDLSQNNLTGVVPDNFTSLSKLETLLLSDNLLTGEIPASLSNVTTLTRFAANQNDLLGSIPPGVTKYVKMLDLSYNDISGNIPADLFFGMNLETIDLTSNNLEGYVDAKFSRSLYRLRLGTNKLSGEIPGTISNASNLAYLELDNNHLEGNIPLNLGGCKNLTLLNLASNRLQGQVPNEIGNLNNLVVLKLQMNNLSGSIPSTFSNFINLNALNLSYNSFSGSIPDGIMKLQNLSSMNLQANKIDGVIPNSISSLKILIELNLGNNLLTGSIPEMPASLSTALNLSHNLLSGNIPSNIGFLRELEILDLSYNNLSGQVPSSFVNLNSLTELVLAYNQLSGFLPTLPKHAAVNITGNPGLTNTNSNNMDTGSKKKRPTILIIIIALAGALMGLCLLAVIVTLSLSKKVYRIENEHSPAEEGAAQIINGSFITLNSTDTTTLEYMKEKRDDWRITPFQALNFEVADIPQGLREENLVGSGGSGHVYRVTYTNRYNSRTGVVAVKQIRSFGSLDEKLEREFESEARILCNIRHNNIVKLLCCLSSADSKLLVCDYMDNGSLAKWLHGDYILRAGNSLAMARPVQRVPLDWPTRLLVAVGAAQGLCYMHHECSPPIVHRDIKTSNILLDSEFRAKIADFGVARMLVREGEPNTMSAVAGSFGYMAPGKVLLFGYFGKFHSFCLSMYSNWDSSYDITSSTIAGPYAMILSCLSAEYAYTRKVNEKVDVYSFGVVLLELTTGKKANDGGELGCLAEWARHHYQSEASILDVIDKSVRYAGYPNEIETAFRLGVECTGILPSPRPTMKDVLQILLKCSERTLRKCRMECSMEFEAAPFLLL
ncbi:unnamed protein product [Miscanthus lutarioriparius]|uniref:Protein kinase domain-containing protein n=1 Tax=Miscanthus lutarioriparius TaxID=422564 RepID=A0A811RD38_9POAL|nr:unnamed protein product [Miscanthus lutarioriparius]